MIEEVCEGGKVSLNLFFIIIILYSVLINMDLRQGNGRSGRGGGVLLSIVAPAPVRPGNESGVLRIGCLNLRGCNEVEEENIDLIRI